MAKRVLLLFTLLPLFLSVKAQPQAGDVTGESSYQIGVKFLQEGRATEALPYLQAAVKINKESYLYRLNAGRAAQFSENFQPCVDNLTEALRLRPQQQTAQVFYLWRAECHAELGNRTAAANDFAKAVELQPGLTLAYSTRIFSDTGNVCRGDAPGKYREAEAFHKAGKIYEAYRDVYVALKCDPKHLPSLRLRLKIESADNTLATPAKFHRVQLAKVEKDVANRPKPDEDDPNSDVFLDTVFDVKKAATSGQGSASVSTTLLSKYLAQIDKMYEGRPVYTRIPPKAPGSPKPALNLYGVVSAGKFELALELIKQGEDVNYQTSTDFGFKKSVLVEAIEKKNLTVVKALLEAGANPNCDLRLKEHCPMAPAISGESTLIVALLIKHKVDVNGLYNSDPTTYLMAAAGYENQEILDLLIESGADRSARNNKGETALEIFERKRRETAAKLPPTVEERRKADLRTVTLGRRGISSLNARFNAHMEFYKKVDGGLLTSDKIGNLRQGIGYLNDVIRNSVEVEKAASRLLNYSGYDAKMRDLLHKTIAEAIRFREDAQNLKKPLEAKISSLNKGIH